MAKEPSANQMVKLNKIIPALDASYGEGGVWSLTGEWINYPRFGGVDIPYWQGFIDLGGYTRQNDLTFYTDDRALLVSRTIPFNYWTSRFTNRLQLLCGDGNRGDFWSC